MKKKEYIQPVISLQDLHIESLLQTLSPTNNGADNGGGANDYAKRQVSYDDDDSSVGFGSDWDF